MDGRSCAVEGAISHPDARSRSLWHSVSEVLLEGSRSLCRLVNITIKVVWLPPQILMQHNHYMSKGEYEEYGPAVVHRKMGA